MSKIKLIYKLQQLQKNVICRDAFQSIGLFANDVIIIGSVRADWPAPFNVTIGNPRAEKLGPNGFECIGRHC